MSDTPVYLRPAANEVGAFMISSLFNHSTLADRTPIRRQNEFAPRFPRFHDLHYLGDNVSSSLNPNGISRANV